MDLSKKNGNNMIGTVSLKKSSLICLPVALLFMVLFEILCLKYLRSRFPFTSMNLGFVSAESGVAEMSSKGASNRYPTTSNGNHRKVSGHINYAWAKDFNNRTLNDHFKRHGEQMKCNTKEAYAAKAVKFANTIDKKHCISFVAQNGTTYKFNKKMVPWQLYSRTGSLSPISSPGME